MAARGAARSGRGRDAPAAGAACGGHSVRAPGTAARAVAGGGCGGGVMSLYRKKPVVIEARQYALDGANRDELARWCGGDWTARYRPTEKPEVDQAVLVIKIPTLEGVMEADPGDWI